MKTATPYWRARGGLQSGFTLVELIMVVVITALVGLGLSSVIRPATQSYVAIKARAELIDQADTALRRIVQDVQRSVPNSIRSASTSCFEVIPAISGGRYRKAADTVNDVPAGCTAPTATCSQPLDTTKTITTFDSLSALPATPVVGDWVVVNNQNANDVYDGLNRSAITAQSTPTTTQGRHRITINAIQFSAGYDGGRFMIVSNTEKAVFFVCSGADGTLNAAGDGKGTLYRVKNYGFNSTYPSSCPSTAGADVLATRIKSCSFVYDPNQGSTQQSGFLAMDIEIARNNETVHLAVGAHVSNVP